MGRGPAKSTGLSSWPHGKQTPDMTGVSSVTLKNRHRTTTFTNVVGAFLIHWRSCS